MTKDEKIAQTEKDIEDLEDVIKELQYKLKDKKDELGELTKPEIPSEMVGKYIKAVNISGEHYVHVEYVTVSGDKYFPHFTFYGFGFSVMNDQVFIANHASISTYGKVKYAVVSEEEFNAKKAEAYQMLENTLDWEKEMNQ